MTVLTVDTLLKAKDSLMNDGAQSMSPVYVAPACVYDDPEKLAAFTRICQMLHPLDEVTVVRQERIK